MIVGYSKLNNLAKPPEYAHADDACADIFACGDHLLDPHKWLAIPTGIALEIPLGYEIQIRAKSGIALNHGVTVLNGIGTVDCGYKGEIKVILINHGDNPYAIKHGQKIAQVCLNPIGLTQYMPMVLTSSQRGFGGFGSTGL